MNASGLTDSADGYLEVGKLIAVDRILIGEVFKDKKKYVISVKIISVETGEVLKSESETATDQYNFRTACKLLTRKLIRE